MMMMNEEVSSFSSSYLRVHTVYPCNSPQTCYWASASPKGLQPPGSQSPNTILFSSRSNALHGTNIVSETTGCK